MSNLRIWDFWSKHYEKLWAQKYSLQPTRQAVIQMMKKHLQSWDKNKTLRILDMGCGVGQLIDDIYKEFEGYHLKVTGVDFSGKMIHKAFFKNPQADYFVLSDRELERIKERFDFIICTHSLPYYSDQKEAIRQLASKLEEEGHLILAHGSKNNLYDCMALGLTSLTTGKARYPSVAQVLEMIEPPMKIVRMDKLQSHPLMPTILISQIQRKKI